MSDNTTSSNTVSNHQPQGVQTVSTRTDATQVMKAKIPQALSSLGGVAKSNDCLLYTSDAADD